MSKYITNYNQAFTNYSAQSERHGYPMGFFSFIRHRDCANKKAHIVSLEKNLNVDDISAKSSLERFFSDPDTTFNNHSFSLYLLDELSKSYPDENWERFYPVVKKAVYYTGQLYRGSLQIPIDAFINGMKGSSSDKIEDYTNDTNFDVGVSTSKKIEVAKSYTITTMQTMKGAHYAYGYLYEINYRGIGGVDIIETLKARGNDLSAEVASHKAEVNIIDSISPKDIEGCWDRNDIFFPNPKYKTDRKKKENVSEPERRERLFIRK